MSSSVERATRFRAPFFLRHVCSESAPLPFLIGVHDVNNEINSHGALRFSQILSNGTTNA